MTSCLVYSHIPHCIRTGWLLLVGLVCLGLVGCGGKTIKDDFAPAFGTVTLDEKPLQNAEVIFETERGRSTARTDCYGKYHAEYSRTLRGVGTGIARVRISTKVIFPDEKLADFEYDPKTGEHSKPELVPSRYNTKSDLTVEITDGGAPYDFDLESN